MTYEFHVFPGGYFLQKRPYGLEVLTRDGQQIALRRDADLSDTEARLWAQTVISRWIAQRREHP